jgi:rod shape-determining protein MreD
MNGIAFGEMNIRPDLLLILLMFCAVNTETLETIIASFAIGLAADISGACIGPYMVAFGVFGSMISQLRKLIIMKKMIHQLIAIFIMALITGTLAHILIYLKIKQSTPSVYAVIFLSALYSGLAGPILWGMLSVISEWMGIRKRRYGRSVRRY